MKTYLFLGHSHIESLVKASRQFIAQQLPDIKLNFINFREERFQLRQSGDGRKANPVLATSLITGVDQAAVIDAVRAVGADEVIIYVNGNQHNVFGLFQTADLTNEEKKQRLSRQVKSMLTDWIHFLRPALPANIKLLLPPPPAGSTERIYQYLAHLKNQNLPDNHKIEPDNIRLLLWRIQCKTICEVSEELSIPVVDLPDSIFNAMGLLSDNFWDNDPTHGNAEYGRRILAEALRVFKGEASGSGSMPDVDVTSTGHLQGYPHPYRFLPEHCFWKQSISNVPAGEVNPVTSPRFRIRLKDKVATAGSCFAQHISKRLRSGGFHFLVTEQAAGNDEAENQVRGYYDFSARYGNIYTARQLLQLFDRAFGYFKPLDRVWPHPGGGYCDPFRPRIEPGGFASEEGVFKDTARHLAAVRKMFRQLDVFVFTLGLTECWISRLDGAAYPVAPGVAGGQYDSQKYAFVNFSAAEVTGDLRLFLQKLRLVNPGAKVILTVSPVPLVATAVDRHVLVSSTYSKSVLRVAAEEIATSDDNVLYFPSYEIVTGPHAEGGYFGPDRRSVTATGVDHVMRIFMAQMTNGGDGHAFDQGRHLNGGADDVLAQVEAIVEAACDEEMLARP